MPDLDENQQRWVKFASGHWQDTRPNWEGRYLTRDVECREGPIIFVFYNPLRKGHEATKQWGGDWWSEPLPPLPGTAPRPA